MRRGSHRRNDPFAAALARNRTGALTRRLASLAALFAILLQAFVVQTHIHGFAGASLRPAIEQAHASSANGAADQSVSAQHKARAECVLCQSLATSGRAVLAASPALISADSAAPDQPRFDVRLVQQPPAHAWQSRAPPIVL
jgi:Protein of unknown function (DUF2946)